MMTTRSRMTMFLVGATSLLFFGFFSIFPHLLDCCLSQIEGTSLAFLTLSLIPIIISPYLPHEQLNPPYAVRLHHNLYALRLVLVIESFNLCLKLLGFLWCWTLLGGSQKRKIDIVGIYSIYHQRWGESNGNNSGGQMWILWGTVGLCRNAEA